MKVLFDLHYVQPMGDSLFHGGAEYTRAVFYRFCERKPDDMKADACFNSEIPIDKSIVAMCKTKNITLHEARSGEDTSRLLAAQRYDTVFVPVIGVFQNVNVPKGTKCIVTWHDIRAALCSDDYFLGKYTKASTLTLISYRLKYWLLALFPSLLAVRRRRRLNLFESLCHIADNQVTITDSYYSKYVINQFFPVMTLDKIKVFYAPPKTSAHITANEEETLRSFSLEKQKYILLIGGDRVEKGAYRACKALQRLFAMKAHPCLDDIKVMVTGVTFTPPYIKAYAGGRFVFSGYVSPEALEILYKNTHLFVYPTLQEGFGYPPLEAMKYGSFCACSANSSVTEICGDAVLYFNPFDENEICCRVLQSFDKEIRAEKAARMKEHFERITRRQLRDLDGIVDEILNG